MLASLVCLLGGAGGVARADDLPLSASATANSVVQLLTGPPALTNVAVPSFTFRAFIAATFQCLVDRGAWRTCGSPFSPGSLADGDHTISVRAVKVVRGVTTSLDPNPLVYAWHQDTKAPDTFALANLSTGAVQTVSEAGASYACSTDGVAWAVCPVPLAIPAGAGELQVSAMDAAGNVDHSPAVLRTALGSGSTHQAATSVAPFAGARAAFAVGGNVAKSTLECSLDNAPFSTCPTGLVFDGLAFAAHTLVVRDPKSPLSPQPSASQSWTAPLVAPQLEGAAFPSVLTLPSSERRQGRLPRGRLPQLLVGASAPGVAAVVVHGHGGEEVWRWSAPLQMGANALVVPKALYRRLAPGRFTLEAAPSNAAGAGSATRVRFDVLRAERR